MLMEHYHTVIQKDVLPDNIHKNFRFENLNSRVAAADSMYSYKTKCLLRNIFTCRKKNR